MEQNKNFAYRHLYHGVTFNTTMTKSVLLKELIMRHIRVGSIPRRRFYTCIVYTYIRRFRRWVKSTDVRMFDGIS